MARNSNNDFLEPLLTLGSAAVAEPIAGWYGLLGGGADGVRKVREAMTYLPRTRDGRRALESLGAGVEAVSSQPQIRGLLDGYGAASDYAGDIHPALGAAMRTLPTAAMSFAGPGSGVTRAATKNVAKGAGRSAVKAGMAAERALDAPVTRALDGGGLLGEMTQAMGTGGQSNVANTTRYGDFKFDRRYDKRVKEQGKLNSLTTTVDVPNTPMPEAINLADYEGHPFITSMADRTRKGLLTHVRGKELPNPVNLQAGKSYMFDDDGLWASAPGPVNDLMENAHYVKLFTGKEPLFLPWTMAPTGSDFSSMTGNTMLSYANANMGSKGKAAVDAYMRSQIPDWLGIGDPGSQAQFSGAKTSLRKKIQKQLDMSFREDGGLGIGEARLAISDPALVGSPEGSVTHAGLFDSAGLVKDSRHVDYPMEVPGRGLGLLRGDHNIYEYLQGQGHSRSVKDPRAPSQRDLRALQMKSYSGLIDANLLRNLGY